MIKKILTLTLILGFVTTSYKSFTYQAGAPSERTNAPSEGNCTGCHSGSLVTSGSNWNNITLNSNFTGGGYIPDSTYAITIKYNQSGISKFGFQITCLDENNKMAGTFTTSSSRVQKLNSTTTGLNREYVQQTTAGTASTGTNSTDWVFNWKAPNKNIGNVKFYIVVNATNANNSDGGDVIYSKTFTISPSSLLPVANAGADTISCAGTPFGLKGNSTNNATSWSWTFTGATPSTSTSRNPTITFPNSGNFIGVLTSKNSKGFSKADTVKINVRTKPSVNITGPSNTRICKTDSVQLTATFNSNYTYSWFPTGDVTQRIWAKDSGDYKVTVTDLNGCKNTSNTIAIRNYPEIVINNFTRNVSNDTVCNGRKIVLTVEPNTIDSIYLYANGGFFNKTEKKSIDLYPSSNFTLTVKGKNSSSCFSNPSSAFKFVTVNEQLAPTSTCSNKSTSGFEINWNDVPGSLGYQVSMDSGKTWKNPSEGASSKKHKVTNFPPNTDIQVWVKSLDKFPCFESNIGKIICGTIPCSPFSFDFEHDTAACKGDYINFKIKNINTNNYGFRIDGGMSFRDTIFKISADISKTYLFEAQDSSNLTCPTIKKQAKVNVYDIPNLNITTQNINNTFCYGAEVQVTVDEANLENYKFIINNTEKQSGNNRIYVSNTLKNTDKIYAVVKQGACIDTTEDLDLDIKAQIIPAFNYTRSSKIYSFSTPEPYSTYNWDFGDGLGSTVSNPTHDYSSSEGLVLSVKLKVSDSYGCIGRDSQLVTIANFSGINYKKQLGFKMYPNPTTSQINFELTKNATSGKVIIINQIGTKVEEFEITKSKTSKDVSAWPSGLYHCLITVGEAKWVEKFEIIK